MSYFSERLSELIDESNFKVNEIAINIGVSVQTLYDWKNGKQQISYAKLISVSDFFHCSIDFLAGRSDVLIDFQPTVTTNFLKAIRAIMKKKNISTYTLRKETRFDGSYFARWDKGSEPKLSTLIELADYLDCTIDQLIGREKL